MTVTLEISEIKEYQGKMIIWGVARSRFIDEWMRKNQHDDFYVTGHSSMQNQTGLKALEEWEFKNPIPKLIPAV